MTQERLIFMTSRHSIQKSSVYFEAFNKKGSKFEYVISNGSITIFIVLFFVTSYSLQQKSFLITLIK